MLTRDILALVGNFLENNRENKGSSKLLHLLTKLFIKVLNFAQNSGIFFNKDTSLGKLGLEKKQTYKTASFFVFLHSCNVQYCDPFNIMKYNPLVAPFSSITLFRTFEIVKKETFSGITCLNWCRKNTLSLDVFWTYPLIHLYFK